jgi:protein-L-isoaspartate(D-aspartate) O-methyltransferase
MQNQKRHSSRRDTEKSFVVRQLHQLFSADSASLREIFRFSLLAFFILQFAAPFSLTAAEKDAYREARFKMVKECIEREGVRNPRVLQAMRTVPRHEFVLPQNKAQAYHDRAIAIGEKQTISPPFVVAYMTETIDPQPDDKILEIGTGSGYQAAVLSGLAKDVYTIEIVEKLGKSAAERLKRLGYDNVHCKIGDGYLGWVEHAPFDKIIVTCSPENVPQPLIDQLNDGGKLLIPLGERYQQAFHLFEKKDGKLVSTKLIPTLFVPMTGESEAQRKIQPDPLNPQLLNGGFEEDDNEDGLADHWYYQRLTDRDADQKREGDFSLHLENQESGRVAQALQAMGIDGAKISALNFRMKYRTDSARAGTEDYEKPGFVCHFYDEQRRDIGAVSLGPWLGTSDWKTAVKTIPVPAKARDVIVRVGLNGATGELWVDDIEMTAKPR